MTAWKTLMTKWSQLARRERILVTLGVVIVSGLFLDGVVIEPARRGLSSASGALVTKQNELAAFSKQRLQLSAEVDAVKVDPALALGVKELSGKSLGSEQLWDAAAAERWFDAAVEDFGGDLTYLSVSSGGEADSNFRSLFAHEWALNARGDWRKVQKFLRETGARGALRVESVEILSDSQGQLSMKVKGKALSALQSWSPIKALKSDGGIR